MKTAYIDVKTSVLYIVLNVFMFVHVSSKY